MKTLSVFLIAMAILKPLSLASAASLKKGKYIFQVAGCGNCHTDPGKKGKGARPKGDPLAGGRPLKTPFGTFYTPNITTDKIKNTSPAGVGTRRVKSIFTFYCVCANILMRSLCVRYA